MRTSEHHSELTPDLLAKRWMIGKKQAEKNTLRVTTQKGIKYVQNPATRRFKTNQAHMRYPHLPGTCHADIMKFPKKSVDGQIYAHTIGNGHGYAHMFPITSKKETSIYSLMTLFVRRVFQTENLQMDNNRNMPRWNIGNKGRCDYRINPLYQYSEPFSPWQLLAEVDVREIKRQVKQFTLKAKSPIRLWNYLGPLACKLRALAASDHPNLQGQSNYEAVHGNTPEIGHYLEHEWYEVIEFRDNDGLLKLTCWLGPSKNHGG